MNITRRDFSKLALASPAAVAFAAKINSKIDGVMFGAQTYSFRDRSLDDCITAMKEIGLGYAELTSSHIEPKDKAALQAWRANPPMEELRAARKKFDDAGIEIYAFNYSFRSDWTDAQIENGFHIAKALGVNRITGSGNVDGTARVDKYAQRYGTYVAFHNHDSMKKNEFSTPDDWKAALDGRSKYIGINLDIGHFTAANFDPVSFLEAHHDRIVTLHIKDRKRNHCDNMPFGKGDTNIRGVLRLLKDKRYPIPAMIEYEYGQPGMDTVAEVKRCFELCQLMLQLES